MKLLDDIDYIIRFNGKISELINSITEDAEDNLDAYKVNIIEDVDKISFSCSSIFVYDNKIKVYIPKMYSSFFYKSDKGILIILHILLKTLDMEFKKNVKAMCPKFLFNFYFLLDMCMNIKKLKLEQVKLSYIEDGLFRVKTNIIKKVGKIGYCILEYSITSKVKIDAKYQLEAWTFINIYRDLINSCIESESREELFDKVTECLLVNRDFQLRIVNSFM